jgi:DNA replicative helicase MCM subunit Mcm2 (Cdc46/Mcm family)
MEPEPLDGPVNLGLESTTDGPKDSVVWQRGGRGSERSTGNGGANDVLTKDFLRKYIHYARHRVKPVLSDEAMDAISVAYADMRSKQTPKNLPITARSLETMIRLASAHAKSRLSDVVNEYDVEEILEIMNYVLFHEIGNYSSPQSVVNVPGGGHGTNADNDKLLPGKRNRHSAKGDDSDLMEQDGEEVKSDEKRSKNGEEEEEFDDDFETYISGSIDQQSPRYRHVQRLIVKLGNINGPSSFPPSSW